MRGEVSGDGGSWRTATDDIWPIKAVIRLVPAQCFNSHSVVRGLKSFTHSQWKACPALS